MNYWMGCGRLGSDIDLKYTPGGRAMARVLLAVDRYGKEGKKTTDWIRLVLWGRDAENAARFTGKGGVVAVGGSIRAEFFEKETPDGKQSRLNPEIQVDRIDFVTSPPQRGNGQPQSQPQRAGKSA
ncbi:MAG: single-stranded DNA-binding protein [Actinobacteria bacterium]|nr:single-stranded DNA-binding protein [Actinomycetota bacterium]